MRQKMKRGGLGGEQKGMKKKRKTLWESSSWTLAESTLRIMQTYKRGTHLQETAAKLFVHGENKQETNQLQKSISKEKYCSFQKE